MYVFNGHVQELELVLQTSVSETQFWWEKQKRQWAFSLKNTFGLPKGLTPTHKQKEQREWASGLLIILQPKEIHFQPFLPK